MAPRSLKKLLKNDGNFKEKLKTDESLKRNSENLLSHVANIYQLPVLLVLLQGYLAGSEHHDHQQASNY